MKKVMAGIMAAALCFSAQATGFADDRPIIENPLTALEELYNKGVVDGYDDGQLHPERLLTRAQFTKFLGNVFTDVPVNEALHTFADMDESHWAYENVQKAVNAGWLEGFPDNTFRPDENITFEQATAVLCRVLGLGDKGVYPTSYIASAIEYSITDGVNALIGECITREQAAILITNASEYSADKAEADYDMVNSFYGYAAAPSLSSGYANLYGGGGSSANVMAESAAVGKTAVYDGMPAVRFNTEEYSAEDENVFKDAVTSPLSTFSIDTDTASYSNLRRFILNGQNIPNGSVRSEELINYFDYEKAPIDADAPFGVKFEVAQCPWNEENKLAMITVSGEELMQPKPSNLVFLIDISGSMFDFNKLPLVKKSLAMLLDKLGENDKVSIVTYASGTGVALEPTSAAQKDKILEAVGNLRAGGATAGAAGITLAYEQAEKFKTDGNNRIILCTDGDFNVGISSEGELEKLITEKRESGIYLSVLGFGMGNYKDNKMETLADKGNGNYAYIDNLREAKKVLVDEMPKTIYTIAKDVKIQAEFNPEKVASYRLIGYENRVLNNEDFENDKKDAGELGAGASVTVLYEIVPQTGDVKADLKYQSVQTVGSDELMNVKIRYKLPDADESVLSEYAVSSEVTQTPGEDFNFAAAVAQLGMILNDSEYKGTSTYDSVIELARKGIGEDSFGLRNEFLQLADLLRYSEK